MKKKQILKTSIIIIILVLIDQIIKMLVRNNTNIFPITIIHNFFTLSYFENNSNLFAFAVITVIEFVILINFLLTQSKNIDKKTNIALSIILSGGMANFIDIVIRRSVTDYLQIFSFNMNIGDIYTIVGWIMFIIFVFTTKISKNDIDNIQKNEEK